MFKRIKNNGAVHKEETNLIGSQQKQEDKAKTK